MTIAELAAEKAGGNNLIDIAEELAEMCANLEIPIDYLDHDMRFHHNIATASQNRILLVLLKMVVSILHERRKPTIHRALDFRQSTIAHREIYHAIRDKRPDDARKLMRQHLIDTKESQKLETDND